jgi:hypothetical protein
MNHQIMQWAIKNRIPPGALEELRSIFHMEPMQVPQGHEGGSEMLVQSLIRIEAARKGIKLWRNNVGALLDSRGIPIRYGLANDSPALNNQIKSGDLIGWRTIDITPQLVGTKIAQFVSRECKRPGWRFTGKDREEAQLRWAMLVTADGGDATFASGEGSL